ncbi:MAG TPA: VOC family protein [Sphaerochaeta sp.]|nr:VOC family protein [Sphaerochaeta sp.]HQB90588.1 VOC family protein [Sphaerochaeta sp.]
MKFLWTTIEVVNVDESVRFYQEIVGLSVDHRIAGEATDIAFMGDGETKIELIAHEGAKPQTGGALISIGFAVDDLDAKIAFLQERGVPITSGPFSPNPRIRFCYVDDPNGVRLQFVEQR